MNSRRSGERGTPRYYAGVTTGTVTATTEKELGAGRFFRYSKYRVFGNEGIGGDAVGGRIVVRPDEGRRLLDSVHRSVNHHRAAAVVGRQVDDSVGRGVERMVVEVALHLERVNVAGSSTVNS